jgi:hypothetical protein
MAFTFLFRMTTIHFTSIGPIAGSLIVRLLPLLPSSSGNSLSARCIVCETLWNLKESSVETQFDPIAIALQLAAEDRASVGAAVALLHLSVQDFGDSDPGAIAPAVIARVLAVAAAAIADPDSEARRRGLDFLGAIARALQLLADDTDLGASLEAIAHVLIDLFGSFYTINQNPLEVSAFARLLDSFLRYLPAFLDHFPNLPQTVSANLLHPNCDSTVLAGTVQILAAFATEATGLLLRDLSCHMEMLLRFTKASFAANPGDPDGFAGGDVFAALAAYLAEQDPELAVAEFGGYIGRLLEEQAVPSYLAAVMRLQSVFGLLSGYFLASLDQFQEIILQSLDSGVIACLEAACGLIMEICGESCEAGPHFLAWFEEALLSLCHLDCVLDALASIYHGEGDLAITQDPDAGIAVLLREVGRQRQLRARGKRHEGDRRDSRVGR